MLDDVSVSFSQEDEVNITSDIKFLERGDSESPIEVLKDQLNNLFCTTPWNVIEERLEAFKLENSLVYLDVSNIQITLPEGTSQKDILELFKKIKEQGPSYALKTLYSNPYVSENI